MSDKFIGHLHGSTMLRRGTYAAAALLAALVPSMAGAAQPGTAGESQHAASTDRVEEVVVTATRRSANLQTVPIAVVAITADRLTAAGVDSTKELSSVVPGLQISTGQNHLQPFLRGVGSSAFSPGWENPVAIYVDGVYLASEISTVFNFNNIQQIEVLKGPQGTLFGRNSTGGAILVTTRTPSDETVLDAEVGYANYDTVTGNVYAAGAISPKVKADIAMYGSNQEDGWGRNLYNGHEIEKGWSVGARSKWLFELAPSNTLTVIGDYARVKTSIDNITRPRPGANNDIRFYSNALTSDNNVYDLYDGVDPSYGIHGGGISASDAQDFGSVRMTNTVAYRSFKSTQLQEIVPPPSNFVIKGYEASKQLSYEFQLASTSKGPIQWTGGIYYIDAEGSYAPLNNVYGAFFDPFFGANAVQLFSGGQKSTSISGYFETTIALLPTTKLTLGGRYIYEKQKADGSFDVQVGGISIPGTASSFASSTSSSDPTYRAILAHNFSENFMGYVSYNHGFKSGGYSISPGATGYNPAPKPVSPEKLDAYALGFKSELFEQRMRLNVEGFYYDYSNMQLITSEGFNIAINNAAKARLYGADLDFEIVVSPDLGLNGGVSWLHTEFLSYPNAPGFFPVLVNPPVSFGGYTVPAGYDAKGNSLPNAPEFTFNIGLDYHKNLSIGLLNATVDYAYNSGWFGGASNLLEQPAYSLLNSSISLTPADSHWKVTVWGKNLTDQRYSRTFSESGSSQFMFPAAPRTFGITLGYHL